MLSPTPMYFTGMSSSDWIATAIQSELGIPVKYIGVGERIDDLQKFNSEQFVTALFDRKDTSSEQ